jgi:dihydroflavonol-4-reductase
MKAFVTGATGFLGRRLAKRLRERGDEVVCLVRTPSKAAELEALACELVQGDLTDLAAIRRGMEGCDAVFHLAADYRVGVRPQAHPKMQDTNVGGTRRVLDTAIELGVKKIVYVSTIAAFGNTRGEIVDETYRHPGDSFTSQYERTKYEAHRIAEDRIAKGAPIVIVQPGGIYGPGDHSALGGIIQQAATGRLPAVSFPKMGMNMAHVDDVVDGVLAGHDRGRPGESYVLGGRITTMREIVDTAARVAGRKPPRMNVPGWLIKAMVPAAPVVTKAMKLPPNMKELISSSDGVTFWAKDDKARAELGYAPRDLEAGLRQTVSG